MQWMVVCAHIGAAGALAGCGDNLAPVLPDSARIDGAPARDAESDTARGLVFVDRDRDGVFSIGDEPAAYAVVFFEDLFFTRADALGRYAIPAQPEAGIVWIRSQDEWHPGPHWALAEAGEPITLDFAIPEQTASGGFSFVVASDTHAGIELMTVQDQIVGLSQAVSLPEVPYFITITGDLTQANQPEHFAWLDQAIQSIDVPFVPVPGNHDWYDGGAAYRAHFGPPTYSFDSGGFHFIVLNDASPLQRRLAFIDQDLALSGAGRTVIVLMHRPPDNELEAELAARDIDVALTGHLHANRVVDHDGFVEYNHQPLVMGGIDTSPAGFRIYHGTVGGQLTIQDRSTVDDDIAVALGSNSGQTFSPCNARLLASVQTVSAAVSVTATIESIGIVTMTPRGGWVWATDPLPLCDDGFYEATVHVARADGTTLDLPTSVDVGAASFAPMPNDWLMFGGSPARGNGSQWTGTFPETLCWSQEVGGTVHGGSPIVQGDRVYVSVTDLADGSAGGIVAIDAVSGQLLWEHRVGVSVPHAPVAADDRIVFLSQDGTVHCVAAETGALIWRYELAPAVAPIQRTLYSAPAVVAGTVFAGGSHEFAAIDLVSGDVVWNVESDLTGIWASRASPAVSDGIVVLPLNRKDGMVAYDAQLGTHLWTTPANTTIGTHASPVIDGDTVYVVNELMTVSALDIVTGETRWQTTAEPDGFYWAYLATATPAVGDGQLYVASSRGRLSALDLATGETQWTYLAEDSLVRSTHYHGHGPALSGSPTWTPGRVWIPGTDGTIRAVDSATGQELWTLALGVPVTSSVVLAGDVAFVASFDGVVRALTAPP